MSEGKLNAFERIAYALRAAEARTVQSEAQALDGEFRAKLAALKETQASRIAQIEADIAALNPAEPDPE